jgi:hypothetical protein
MSHLEEEMERTDCKGREREEPVSPRRKGTRRQVENELYLIQSRSLK